MAFLWSLQGKKCISWLLLHFTVKCKSFWKRPTKDAALDSSNKQGPTWHRPLPIPVISSYFHSSHLYHPIFPSFQNVNNVYYVHNVHYVGKVYLGTTYLDHWLVKNYFQSLLEGTAHQEGLLLVSVEGFGLWPKLFFQFRKKKHAFFMLFWPM